MYGEANKPLPFAYFVSRICPVACMQLPHTVLSHLSAVEKEFVSQTLYGTGPNYRRNMSLSATLLYLVLQPWIQSLNVDTELKC
jgi:hypothetical protein